MVTVPPDHPNTAPVVPSTVAMYISLLDHVPPAGVEFNVLVTPAQKTSVPVIVPGNGLTVTIVVLIQPVGSV